ncbi:hypothetical protein QRX50_19520 [Amycolatopsis carbonis]|uniref:Uncharacterized protein n=1 Tax=Amycolatopsis carbonis TaxID=715471 RepID=A0A9Y2MZN8_9PSEU|nr:hypothetical protein [Amycolatopsis sp. 2-15]WIX82808.1 hypothetical protein QRX50_19520 [Amycolatopsis sp. 2-15]
MANPFPVTAELRLESALHTSLTLVGAATTERVADAAALGGRLDRYLADGYDVERAADGWVLLRRGSTRVTLTVRPEERGSGSV